MALFACLAGAQEMPPPVDLGGIGESLPAPTPMEGAPKPAATRMVTAGASSHAVAPRCESWDHLPVAAETSGTWLDRGYWYSEVEAVAMVRQWNRQRQILAFDTSSNRRLSLGRSTPGREGSARLTLGRFLFRDQDNRDHNLEFTVLGGGEFGQNSRVFAANSDDPNDLVDDPLTSAALVVNTNADLGSGVTFTGAESMFVQYDSRMNSFEWNYVMSTRLPRDRMELMPSGEWVRRANGGFTYQFLGGLRYIDLTENLDWTANNITSTATTTPLDGESGRYTVRSSNDLFGPQVGFGSSYKGGRFSVESMSKLAVLANDLKTRSGLAFTDPATGDARTDVGFTNANRTDTLSMVAEFSLTGRYHIQPNVSWRLGYQMLYVTHVALAPHQVDFEPDDASVSSTGDVFYHGISTGIDFYW